MVEPPPAEIEEERQGMAAGESDHPLPTVLTPEHMATLAAQAGFGLTETHDDLLEQDLIYILEKE